MGVESLNKLFQSDSSNYDGIMVGSNSTEFPRGTLGLTEKSGKQSCLSNLAHVKTMSQFYAL
jgi:hypothetical protein